MQEITQLAQNLAGKSLASLGQNPKSPLSAAVTKRPKTLGVLVTDHLSSRLKVRDSGQESEYSEKELLTRVLHGAAAWMDERKQRPGLAFVVVSGALPETAIVTDHKGRALSPELFDGFGCGKTTMAEIMYQSCSELISVPQNHDFTERIEGLRQAADDDPGLAYVAKQMNTSIDQARQNLIAAYEVHQGEAAPAIQQVQHKGRFFTAADLMEKLGGGIDDDGRKITERAGAIIGFRSEIVVIDDVGREGVIPFVAKEVQQAEMQNRYYRVVDYCYRRFKNGEPCPSLVLTSNMRVEKLKHYLGGAVWTRLEEMCPQGFIHDMTGVRNYRKLARGA